MRAEDFPIFHWSRGDKLPLLPKDFEGRTLLIEDINTRIRNADLFFARLCRDVLISRGLEEEQAAKVVQSAIDRLAQKGYERVTQEMAAALKLHGGRPTPHDVARFQGSLERMRDDYLTLLPDVDIGARPHPWAMALCEELSVFPFEKRIIRTTAPEAWARTLNTFFKLPAPTKVVRPEIGFNWDSLFTSPGTHAAMQLHRSNVAVVVHTAKLFLQALEQRPGVAIFISPQLLHEPEIGHDAVNSYRRNLTGTNNRSAIYLIAPDSSWRSED